MKEKKGRGGKKKKEREIEIKNTWWESVIPKISISHWFNQKSIVLWFWETKSWLRHHSPFIWLKLASSRYIIIRMSKPFHMNTHSLTLQVTFTHTYTHQTIQKIIFKPQSINKSTQTHTQTQNKHKGTSTYLLPHQRNKFGQSTFRPLHCTVRICRGDTEDHTPWEKKINIDISHLYLQWLYGPSCERNPSERSCKFAYAGMSVCE